MLQCFNYKNTKKLKRSNAILLLGPQYPDTSYTRNTFLAKKNKLIIVTYEK